MGGREGPPIAPRSEAPRQSRDAPRYSDTPHPLGECAGLSCLDLRRGESVPASHGHLAQRRHRLGAQAVRRAEDLAAAAGAAEVAGDHGGESGPREAESLGLELALTFL